MLTQKQKLFAEARERGVAIKPAAIEAGCPDKTAAQAGSRLEKHPAVIDHRARLRDAKENPSRLTDDPLTTDGLGLLESVIKNPLVDIEIRIDAAKAALPYQRKKLGDAGKKDAQRDAANAAAVGSRFGGRPHLKSVK